MMPKYDEALYAQAMAKCVYASEPWRGTIADVSRFQRAVAWNNPANARWVKRGNLETVYSLTGTTTTTAAIPIIVTIAAPFSCEYFSAVPWYALPATPTCVMQRPGDGGFNLYRVAGNFYLATYTAVGALARYTTAIPGSPTPTPKHTHVIGTLDTTALTAFGLVNGIVVSNTIANTGVPAQGSNFAVYSHYFTSAGVLARVFQPALTVEESQCLYAAARSLVSG